MHPVLKVKCWRDKTNIMKKDEETILKMMWSKSKQGRLKSSKTKKTNVSDD